MEGASWSNGNMKVSTNRGVEPSIKGKKMKLTRARRCTLRKQGRPTPQPLKCLEFSNIQQKRFLGFFAVSIENCETVGDLKHCIFTQKNLSVNTVLYNGVKLTNARRLSSFLPDFQIGPPRFCVHTKAPPLGDLASGFSFNIENLERKTYQVALPSLDSTIQELKDLIARNEGMSCGMISLTSGGRQLNSDDATLKECNLEPGCYIRLMGKLLGGVKTDIMKLKNPKLEIQTSNPNPMKFVDLENTDFLDLIPLSKNAPQWRLSVKGLNIEGRCTNRKCKACLEMVICRLGMTAFNLLSDDEVSCPVCKFSIEPETCGFRKCEWMFEGRKLGIASVDVRSQWMVAGKKYARFDEATGENTAVWKSLIITAKPLQMYQKKGVHGNGNCPICHFSFSLAKFSQRVASCGDTFHDDCLTGWEQKNNTTCPHCTQKL